MTGRVMKHENHGRASDTDASSRKDWFLKLAQCPRLCLFETDKLLSISLCTCGIQWIHSVKSADPSEEGGLSSGREKKKGISGKKMMLNGSWWKEEENTPRGKAEPGDEEAGWDGLQWEYPVTNKMLSLTEAGKYFIDFINHLDTDSQLLAPVGWSSLCGTCCKYRRKVTKPMTESFL